MRTTVTALAALLALLAAWAPGHGAAARSDVPALAAADTLVVRVTGGAIDSAFRSLAASRVAADFARDLPTGEVGRYQLVVLSRREVGPPEFHAQWSDVVLVRAGRAVLRTGPALAGRVDRGGGEATGAGIPAAHERAVGAGDVLVIPAGLAHQWRPTGAGPFSYVVLKLHPAPGAGTPRTAGVP